MKLSFVYFSLSLLKKRKNECSSSSSDNDRCLPEKRCNLIFASERCRSEESSSDSLCKEKVRCPRKCKKEIICFDKKALHRGIRGDMDQYLYLIQGVITQGVVGSTKLTQGFANEIIRHLTSGVRNILKLSESQASEELNRVEQKILEIIRRYSDEILNEVDELVTTTNNDLLDNLIQLIKNANAVIRNEVQKLAPQPIPPPDKPTNIDLAATVAIVNNRFADLISNILLLFKKTTSTERGLLNKILIERRNGIIKDVTQVLNGYREFLNTIFSDIQASEAKLINSTFDQSSKKLIIELDNILSQIGQNIISIIKGCNTNFRPPLTVNPAALCSTFGANNFL